jgi:hypothetical protein
MLGTFDASPDPERLRLAEHARGERNWKRWGAYVAERQWGTVREDYSQEGDAWGYFTHEMARSRAYRWGEDGIGGFCDDQQRVCLSVALWNGRDPFLKERLFGLTGAEGNHGEDVKEEYRYLDATPTHSYLKLLYKYPQTAFPYDELRAENARRDRNDREFELIDTGIFDSGEYFDVIVEYAKVGPDDILMRVTAWNRGSAPARLHLLPQILFRNTWSWGRDPARPMLRRTGPASVGVEHPLLGPLQLQAQGEPELVFCDNDTNTPRLYGAASPGHYYKDGVNDYVVHGIAAAIHPEGVGTKAALHYDMLIAPGQSAAIRLRLSAAQLPADPFERFDELVRARSQEADAFYAPLHEGIADEDARMVQRQALAGMIWNQQFYYYDVPQWLAGDPCQPTPPAARLRGRNAGWTHLNNADVVSMPDTWEYPWYASWDLAFHCVAFASIDPEFAKHQLVLLTREWYMHPSGQIPAYEWSFSDVNPPVHAWAAWRVFQIDRKHHRTDAGDIEFLERVFHKLLLNFTWWVNRKDPAGRNIFQGGFLGLDNIGVFDRSMPLPMGGHLSQADATSWMAMFCLNMMRIALELSQHNPVYQDLATKFLEHFLYIAGAMTRLGGNALSTMPGVAADGVNLWDPEDEFYYDAVVHADGHYERLKVRSMVGLIPLFAVETLEPELLARVPEFKARLKWFLDYRPDLAALVSRWQDPGHGQRRLLSLLRGHRMKCLLRRMLDESEFLSPYGVRSMSRVHLGQPFAFDSGGHRFEIGYRPGESDSDMFGGNSNWRGPVWMPVNYLIIESLQKFHQYYGPDFKVECPTGSQRFITLLQVAEELTRRLVATFLRDDKGTRPAMRDYQRLREDPGFDHPLFHEHFDGDTGRGLGASHQTGWTGLVAKLLMRRDPD